jgi:hypothetical protein
VCCHGIARVGDELLAELVEAHQRALLIAWPGIDFQHILHGTHKGGALLRRQAPLLGAPGF